MSNYSQSYHKRLKMSELKKGEQVYPALCPMCMKELGVLNDYGTLRTNMENTVYDGKFYFCSHKCCDAFKKELEE